MSLAARIQTATLSELNEGLLEEISAVLDAIHKRAALSEDFSRAISYQVTIKASSPDTTVKTNNVSQSTSVSSSIFSTPTAVPPPTKSKTANNTEQSISTPSPLNHINSAQTSSASDIWVSQAIVSKIQSPKLSAHQDIQSFLHHVKTGQVDFWNPNVQQKITMEDARLLQVPINYGLYLCFVLKGTEVHHKILYRFARVILYRLSLQSHTAQSLAQALQGITLFKGRDAIEKHIEDYISAGSRYTHIADQLGGPAALFFLPHDIGNSFWERKIPKKGPNHHKVIQALKTAGISQVSKPFHQLAIDLLHQDAIDVVSTHALEGMKRSRDETHPYEPLKEPKLLAVDRPPRSRYDSLCEQPRRSREDTARDAPSHGQLEQIVAPSAIPPTNQGSQNSVQVAAVLRGEEMRQGAPNTRIAILPNTGFWVDSILYDKVSVARLDSRENILGKYLLGYMETSRTRYLEDSRENMGPMRLTSAASLYIAAGKDFKLEISLSKSAGEKILQKLGQTASLEYLEILLGEFLFESMMASTHRTEEKERGELTCTSAVKVSVPIDDEGSNDYKLGVMLGYNAGVKIWYAAF